MRNAEMSHVFPAVLDSDSVVPDHQRQRLLPPKAAMRLSGSRKDPADDCNWVEN
jgi:hypothetical protein